MRGLLSPSADESTPPTHILQGQWFRVSGSNIGSHHTVASHECCPPVTSSSQTPSPKNPLQNTENLSAKTLGKPKPICLTSATSATSPHQMVCRACSLPFPFSLPAPPSQFPTVGLRLAPISLSSLFIYLFSLSMAVWPQTPLDTCWAPQELSFHWCS